jgi:hypothetical protein
MPASPVFTIGCLKCVIFDNKEASEARYELIDMAAESSIVMLTWSFDGLLSEALAELVEKHKAGIQCHVIIDKVNLYYLALLSDVTGTMCKSLLTLHMLEDNGIQMRMLKDWHGN